MALRYFSTPSAKRVAKGSDSASSETLIFFLVCGKPNTKMADGMSSREKTIATMTPKAVKIPKYLIG